MADGQHVRHKPCRGQVVEEPRRRLQIRHMNQHLTFWEDLVHHTCPSLQQFRKGIKSVVQRPMGPHHAGVDFIAQLDHGRRRSAGFKHFQGATHMARHGLFDRLKRHSFPRTRQGLVTWIGPRVTEMKIEQHVHAQIVPHLCLVHHFEPRTVQPFMGVVPNAQPHHIHALVAHPCTGFFDQHTLVRAVHDAVVNHFRKERGIDASPGLSAQRARHQQEPSSSESPHAALNHSHRVLNLDKVNRMSLTFTNPSPVTSPSQGCSADRELVSGNVHVPSSSVAPSL